MTRVQVLHIIYCFLLFSFFSYLLLQVIRLLSCILSEDRLLVVPHFSSGIVEGAKRERAWKSPHARKGDTRQGERKMRDYRQSPSFWPFTADWFWSVKFIFLSPRRVSPFLAWGDFHARSRFARSTIPEEKLGTTRSLEWRWQSDFGVSILVTT